MTDKPKPVRKVNMEVSLKECDLILKLRKVNFGVIEIHKLNGDPTRIIIKESHTISEQDAAKEIFANDQQNLTFPSVRNVVK